MADLVSAEILRSLRDLTQESSLDLCVKSDWGSDVSQFREKIHQTLGQLPEATSASISHAQGLGGFAFISAAGKSVGFDIEPSARVSDQVTQRVSSPEEFLQAPSAAHLWVAKEAVFKALRGPQQPKVISQISIGGWQKVSSQIETFEFLASANASKGVVFTLSPFILAIFIFSPQNLP